MNDSSTQARTVGVLVAGQVLAGLGQGATIAIGAIIAGEIAGPALSGMAATASTLGAAIVAIPLARLASRFGRRPALALGATTAALGSITTVIATGLELFPLLLLGFALLGVGTAVGLQARFAATDAAAPNRRGRDLSLVVWSTTIGAVIGPNLFGPGEAIQEAWGLPEHTGSFVIAIVAQLLAASLYFVALRPDPLFIARGRTVEGVSGDDPGTVKNQKALNFAIATIAISHAVMVSVMSMTPVHLVSHGASLTIVGITISLHVAGMFALSPVFGWASDRWGRLPVIFGGHVMLATSVILIGLAPLNMAAVTAALILLGLGWSAATVAGSALVSDLVTGKRRLVVQGRTDTIMSLSGAVGGATAGVVLALIGYSGLAWTAGILVLGMAAAATVMAVQRAIPRY